MYAEERQQAMAQLVAQRGRVSVNDLATEYDVTTETVRRDLSRLERVGLVRRVHGGAVPADSLSVLEAAVGERDSAHAVEKDEIAHAAIALLPPPGATILLDAGTTTFRFAALLPRDHRLVVVTHCVPIAARLTGLPHIELHLLPGRVRDTTQAAVGAETLEALNRVRADVTVLGTNAISVEHGLSTPDREEAAVKRALASCGRRVIALTDSSKFGQESAVRFAALADVDVLVTDSGLSRTERRRYAAAGPEVVIA